MVSKAVRPALLLAPYLTSHSRGIYAAGVLVAVALLASREDRCEYETTQLAEQGIAIGLWMTLGASGLKDVAPSSWHPTGVLVAEVRS